MIALPPRGGSTAHAACAPCSAHGPVYKRAVSTLESRPPLARARVADAHGSFGALVAAAATEPEAARGLAAAYGSLPAHERARLLDAVIADARKEAISPAAVLASLLPTESDPALARRIAASLVASDPHALRPCSTGHALFGGDSVRGAILLVVPLYAGFVEVLTLEWDATGIVASHSVPLVRFDRAEGEAYRLPPELQAQPTPMDEALEQTRAAIWRHRRLHGRVPAYLDRFAHAFGQLTP